jgi:hypothetical protein
LPALLALVGAFLMWHALTRMTYYNHDRGAPGPGFMAFWVALGIAVTGCAVALRAARGRGIADEEAAPDRAGALRILAVLAGLAALLALFERLGFVIGSALFTALAAWMLGMRSPFRFMLFAAGAALSVYVLFALLLDVRLPTGPLPF